MLPIIPVDGDDWLDDAACAALNIDDFFVQAGHVIDERILNTCRGCPVRVQCVKHSYNANLNITGGYFGGLSPGQRRDFSIGEALDYIKSDTLDQPRSPVASEDVFSAPPDEDDEPIVYS
ncbi:MAG: WhiB family transcriptional regulator [Candidatus Paceibacterota bacterium]